MNLVIVIAGLVLSTIRDATASGRHSRFSNIDPSFRGKSFFQRNGFSEEARPAGEEGMERERVSSFCWCIVFVYAYLEREREKERERERDLYVYVCVYIHVYIYIYI